MALWFRVQGLESRERVKGRWSSSKLERIVVEDGGLVDRGFMHNKGPGIEKESHRLLHPNFCMGCPIHFKPSIVA